MSVVTAEGRRVVGVDEEVSEKSLRNGAKDGSLAPEAAQMGMTWVFGLGTYKKNRESEIRGYIG
jgi:hypothetical protein